MFASRRSAEAAQLRPPRQPSSENPWPISKVILSNSRSLFDRDPLPLQPIQFHFRGQCIHGRSKSADNGMHFNVLRVHLRLSIVDIAMRRLIALSKSLHQWASPRWPKLTLPATIILKMARPRDPPDHLEKEKEVFPRLKPIQGTVVPVFFGIAQCEGKEALVLSDVGGYPLYSIKTPSFTEEEFDQKARPAMRALRSCGYWQGNSLLANYHLVHGNIFILDHEMTAPIKEDEDEAEMESIIKEDIDDMWHELQRIQQPQRNAGLR